MYPTLRTPHGVSPDTPHLRRNSGYSRLNLIFLPASVILWVVGILTTNTSRLGSYGLIAVLSPFFFLGVALLAISAAIEFAQPRLSEVRLSLHATALVVMLYGTAPLLYSEGRYPWLYKTIGVVQYVDAHGSLDGSIDIYQRWPGFFALAGWFDKVAGVSSPLDYAKWVPLIFELVAIPLLYTIYRALFLQPWHCWLAIMLYSASNWIGQDYFSPQGMSTLISFGIMAVVARWLLAVEPRKGGSAGWDSVRTRRSLPFIVMMLVLFFVLTASHELSPYILSIQIAALVVCGLARPRWVALAVVAITIAYLAPNFTYVNTHYGLTASIGSFITNIRPPKHTGGGISVPLPESTRILNYFADGLSLGIWLLALVGAWLRRKAWRIVLALCLLAFSPVLVLAGGAYGNEGILRVYLFSLPWAAALAACAIAPVRSRENNTSRSPLRVLIPLAFAITLFFPAFYGSDQIEVMTSAEVSTLLDFQETAKPGLVLAAVQNYPFYDTARYNEFPSSAIFGSLGIVRGNSGSGNLATYLARTVIADFGSNQVAYVIVTPSMIAYSQYYGLPTPGDFTNLLSSLAKSPYWRLIASRDGTVVYRLRATADTIPPGPHADTVVAGVP